jgi:hypothetical protein
MLKKERHKKILKKRFIRSSEMTPLRHQIATALNIESNSVYIAAVRKSAKLSLPFIVDLIAKSTGKAKSEIIES